jgi:hypothetical protein
MTAIFAKTYEPKLQALIKEAQEGTELELWTFDDATTRKAAEAALVAKGVKAKVRSAYKPLVYAFLEEIDLMGASRIEVRYPVHPNAPENRFRLEAYPLAALVGNREINFTPRSDAELFYDVEVTGESVSRYYRVAAPNRVHQDVVGEINLSPCGYLILNGDAAEWKSPYEQLFAAVIAAVANHPWGDAEPYFEELNIRVNLPAADEELPYGDEVVSLREALHEDFYFSLLELFQKKSGRPLGDRGLKPGQIVPEIIFSGDEISAEVTLKAHNADLRAREEQVLDTASQALSAIQVNKTLEGFGSDAFSAKTRSGRDVNARYVAGRDFAVMISAGQHANETTGVTGALRAAVELSERDDAHFTISPLENPDGYQLHQLLCVDNPRHMHHAARYTALGDDLEYRSVESAGTHLNEKAIRFQAQEKSGALLHVNLHGYPSHEWTRPLSGYTPRGFAMWTIPKGFFLIARYHAGWESEAESLLDQVTKHLGAIDGLLDYNAKQIALYERHAGETGFRMINGFPCLVDVDNRHDVPMTLITEYPDETIYGEAYVAGHTAQMQTVLSAYDAWQTIMTARGKLSA